MTRESQSEDVVQICIRRCMSDDDCSASTIGNMMCREIRFGTDACVSAEVAEGEVAELSLRRGGPMTGCDDELSAGGTHLVGVARYAGSGLWELEDDQSSCLRQCSVDDPDDCTAVAPHCSAPFFNSDEVPGICLAAHLKQGATCSRKNGLQQCSRDRDADGRLVCWDYIGQEDDPAVGQCHQLCSVRDQDCINSADPNQSPRCLDLSISSTNDDLGLCSDECSRHPDSCAGMGSNGMGQNCFYGFLRSSTTATIDNPSVAFCYDIQPPVLGAWTAPSMPFDNCDDNRLSCPDRTYCETNGFRNGRGGCMYGCTTATTATSTRTGCEDGAPYMECSPARSPEFKAGRCAPL